MLRLKEPFNGLSHLVGALASLVGLIFLLFRIEAGVGKVIAILIYGLSLVVLYSSSAAYHLLNVSKKTTKFLRKLDHAAIFLLIAGTYTPFCVITLSGAWRWAMLLTIWSIALSGIILKLSRIKVPRAISTSIYLGMGWLAIIPINKFGEALPWTAMLWLGAGGLLYTFGALIYATKRLDFFPGRFGFHEIFHLFVLAGSSSHFVAVFVYLVPFQTVS